ncbi:RelA/SpoT family protein [Limnochorda pilosa]|uniref:GTP diphosphokinase n=1 Tax=Limnochorda pilosa TaxID=1555112 RepID=A0A0K2SN83_LIMPI|nr:bifunctional (p)ppGpp synthetase/guanosine-3',5'-bis(diphosphate) 3'-pyrophosphohydrolase [Limnochorda pilosa]BAS28462.1 (p)ppGpp synthetase [Limnochorda pilosa]
MGKPERSAEVPVLTEEDRIFETLVQRVLTYNPQADAGLLRRAYETAQEAHRNQRRDSGVAYVRHPLEVALLLSELELDVVTLAAGLLHDVLEDTPITREELEERFGSEVLLLVDGVTKLSRIPTQSREEHQAQSLRKMFLAMAEDLRVIVIKLADRLHNMRTLDPLPPERQRKIARETLEIFAPLAHRLGMWSIKWEMEDEAFRYMNPEAYYSLAQRLAKKRKEREAEVQEALELLRRRLEEAGFKADIFGRPKHLYSIYQKMQRQQKDLNEIYDLIAVRVVVETVRDCYGVLGLVHTLWTPIPGRFKDYIAMPKSNLYQSLHTTVVGPKGDPLEIQIRTREMHRIAEKGIAAHWLYKEGYRSNEEFEKKVAWLREVMEWLREMRDPQEFMETLKIDLFEDEVFVFTPKGDVRSLPTGSTPVDFAFSIHTDIGLHCAGAKVNGRIVPLNHRLRNGEFVEILTAKNAAPSQDWLSFVKTSKARSKIRAFLKEARRAEMTQRGRELLEAEARRLGVEPGELSVDRIEDAAKRAGLAAEDDFYAQVGFGSWTVNQALGRVLGESRLKDLRRRWRLAHHRGGRRARVQPHQMVRVPGLENVLIRFSKCCSPVPGDEIIGYITRGRGVSIHRRDCPNTEALGEQEEREIAVEWVAPASVGGQPLSFPVEIEVEAVDRTNLLTQVMDAVSQQGKMNIEAVNARTTRGKVAYINLVVDITDTRQMDEVMERLQRVKGVSRVSRARPT